MTLKLIDKDLRSKYAEALYKNESSYEKDIDRRFQRLDLDQFRSISMVDASAQVFLNQVRQKRAKWINDDLKFREHYRHVCRNVHSKKLENLNQSYDLSQRRRWDPNLQVRYNLLQQQLKLKETNQLTIENEKQNSSLELDRQASRIDLTQVALRSSVPKLPNIVSLENDFKDLYSRFSTSDKEFLDKFPAKVELTVTHVGKQFILNETTKAKTLKRQKQKYTRIQDNATKDTRFKNLVSYLDE